ncbi:unnamed protein product [Calicophoron daubneyi]|uniref:StAR-related lipid transfer protein 3 n=1 Tax=Calicophoron daubneyi TaxID=300641 RepID=A0AAV2T8W2_CALDB
MCLIFAVSLIVLGSDRFPSFGRGEAPFGALFGRSDINLAASTSVIEGLPDEQRTSPVRRTFLLLMVFDLLLCFILWIIYVQQSVSLGVMIDALKREVVNYTFRTSLFDTVVLAAARFLAVEVVYGAVQSRTPWWSAGTTGLTCLILVTKCFLFDFHQHGADSTGLVYAVLIAALILTWLETSFLIYRVIPQEKAASHVASCLNWEEMDEAQSLLGNRFSSQRVLSAYTASAGYFTPQGSVFDDEIILPVPKIVTASREAAVDVAALLTRSSMLRSELWYLYRLEAWNNEPSSNEDISVQNASLPGYGPKVFRMETFVDTSPRAMYNDFVFNVAQSPSWNKSLEAVELIQSLPSENIDIVHNVISEALGGAISKRDLVLLRTWGEMDGIFFLGSTSVEHPKCLPQKDCVRAQQLISACIMEPVQSNPCRCKIIWILCHDWKLYFPLRIVDKTTTSELHGLLRAIRARAKNLSPDVGILNPLDINRARKTEGKSTEVSAAQKSGGFP